MADLDFAEPIGADNQRFTDLTLDIGRPERLEITNFTGELPEIPPVKDRTAFVKVALGAEGCNLDEDGLHAIARALTKPDIARQMLRFGLVSREIVGPSTVKNFLTTVLLTELIPLLQPRSGGAAADVDPPRIQGIVHGVAAQATLTMTFRDIDHLRSFMRQTIVQTRHLGADYGPSILANKVSRPVLVHAARLAFADGSPSFDVLVVRDGITRVVSSWSSQLEGKPTPTQIAEYMTTALLASKTSRKLGEPN